MTPSEARQLVNRHSGLRWIETGVEPWDHAYHKGNTSVALNFEGSGLVAYEVSWESRFMFTEVMNAVNLCAGRPPAHSHPS